MTPYRSFGGARQRGVSIFGIIVILALLGGFLSVGLKLMPIYLDHNVISGVAESLQESGRAAQMTQTEIRTEISNSLRVNNIRDFELSSVTANTANNRTVINIAYEKRVPLFFNIDAVVSFDDSFE